MKHLVAATIICLAASTGLAGQADATKIPANTNWIAHFDIKGLMATQLYKTVIAPLANVQVAMASDSPSEEGEDGKLNPRAAAAKFIEQMEQLDSITVFAPKGQEDQPTMLIVGKYDRNTILKLAQIDESKKPLTHNNYEIYSMTHPGRKKTSKTYLCFRDATTIVSGASLDLVKEELDLLDGKGQSISQQSELFVKLTQTKDAFAAMAIDDVPSLVKTIRENKGHIPPMMSRLKTISMSLTENANKLVMSAKGLAQSEDDAVKMETAINGVVAMMELSADGDDTPSAIMRSIKVVAERKGDSVTCSATTSVKEIVTAIAMAKFKEMGFGGMKPGKNAKSQPTSQPAGSK